MLGAMRRLVGTLNWVVAGLLACAAVFAVTEPVTTLGDADWAQPLVMATLLVGGLLILNRFRGRVGQWSSTKYRLIWAVLLVLIVGAQVWVAMNFVDVSRADGYFVRNQAIALAQGRTTWNHYFMVYQNNVNYTLIDAWWLKLLLPVTKAPWVAMNLLRYLWLDTGLAAGLYLLHHWRLWQPGAFWFTLLWLLSIPVYALGLFDYTDPVVFPLFLDSLALVSWSVDTRGWRRWLGGGLALLLVSVGVAVKSNLIVLWLALGLLILLLWWQRRLTWRQVVVWIAGACLVLGGVFAGMSVWSRQAGYRPDPNAQMPVTAWIAMSMNPQNPGTYSLTDAMVIDHQPTARAKQAAATKLLNQRLNTLGVSGVLVQLARKFEIFWSTGDMDSFKLTTQWLKAPRWYLMNQRSIQFWLVLGTQVLYLTLLCQSICFLLKVRPSFVAGHFLAIAMLGLMIFHVFFWEVEPRYAAPVLPALMLLGTLGWCGLPVWKRTPTQVQYGRWFGTFAVIMCALSLGQTDETTLVREEMPGRQGNGDYFTLPVARVAPQRQLTWTMPVVGPSNALQLQIQPTNEAQEQVKANVQPQYPNGRLRVQVHANGRLLKTWHSTPNAAMAKPLRYPQTTAQSLTITLRNTGKTPFKYAQGLARYDQHTGEVLPRERAFPQAYLLNLHGARALTAQPMIWLSMGLFLGLLLWAL